MEYLISIAEIKSQYSEVHEFRGSESETIDFRRFNESYIEIFEFARRMNEYNFSPYIMKSMIPKNLEEYNHGNNENDHGYNTKIYKYN